MENIEIYKEFIEELEDNLKEGFFEEDNLIQILRGTPLENGYCPILEWYFEDAVMQDFDEDDELFGDYMAIKSELVTVSIKDALDELKEKIK